MTFPSDTLAIVVAGERGTALGSLTRDRAKAAVPFGGSYRIVDFVLSNCLHSGLRQVYVLTQHNAHSLHEHLRGGWRVFNPELGEFITAVPPQVHDARRWYQGNAQALGENLFLIRRSGARRVLILPGGQIYRMDYGALLETHNARQAESSIGYVEGPAARWPELDRLELDDEERVVSLNSAAAAGDDGSSRKMNASMGVMVMELDLLEHLLQGREEQQDPSGGLAAELFRDAIGEHRVFGYQFGGHKGRVSQDRFFSPVSDIDAYFDANMALLEPVPTLDLYQENWPVWSYSRRLPPARTVGSRKGNEGLFVNSIVSNGAVITGGAVSHSVLCPRVRVEDSASVERCILFDDVTVGEGAELRNCIIDKRARIPAGMRVGFDAREDVKWFEVTPKGVVVVPKEFGVDRP